MLQKLDFLKLKEKTKKDIIDYLKKTEHENLVNLKIEIVNYILKNLTEEDNFKDNKIYLGMPLWVKAHNNDNFKKHSDIVNSLVKDLKAKSFISKLSRDYPKNHVLFSVNPLINPFIKSRVSNIDKVIELRNGFLEKLKDFDFCNVKDKNLEYEINLFIFLKLFFVEKIPNIYFEHLNRKNILYVNDKVIFVIKGKEENGFIPINTIVFDKFASSILLQIFPKNADSLFKVHERFFSEDKDYNFYYNKLENYCKNNNLSVKDIKNNISLEYILKYSPLSHTLKTKMRYPKVSLFEIEKLYPNSVNKELLQIEHNNYKIYRNINKDEDDNTTEIIDDLDDELDLQTELNVKFDVYEKLKDIQKVPDEKKQITEYVNSWKNFMDAKRNQDDRLFPIFNHLKHQLDKFKSKKINSDTLRRYLRVLFDYCFDIFVKSKYLEEAIKDSDYKLRNSSNIPETQIQYQSIIRLFFRDEFKLEFNKIDSVINYNRSVVFEDELDKVVRKLIYADKKLYKDEISVYRRAVFTIISFYSGLRKGELFSRQFKDFSYIGYNKFYIDVNVKGINIINKYLNKKDNKKEEEKVYKKVVSLKNSNAVRAFEFEITNTKHLNFVKKYYENIEKHEKIRFLFPGNTKDLSISKYRVMNIPEINEINSILQDTTKRLTPLHALRHSFVTNEIKKLLDKKDRKIEDIFDLIFRIGHGEPETTMKYYAHLGLIKIIE